MPDPLSLNPDTDTDNTAPLAEGSLSAIVTKLEVLRVLLAAANVDHAANEVLLTTISGNIADIEALQTSANALLTDIEANTSV